MSKKKDTLCPLPFIQAQIDIDGAYTICCTNRFYDEDGKVLAYPDIGVSTFWNHPSMIEMRNVMFRGEWPKQCDYCRLAEERDERSQRLNQKEVYKDRADIHQIIEECRRNGGISKRKGPRNWLMLFENSCNLMCRMCCERCSSSFASESLKLGWPTKMINAKQWYDQDFEKSVEGSIKEIDLVYLAGGEPTMMKSAARFLDYLVEKKYSQNIHVALNTNLTNVPDEFYQKLLEFRGATVNLSIDGHGKVQEYIRYPSKWDQIENNLKRLVKNYQSDKVSFEFFPTFQTLNLLNLPDLFHFYQKWSQVKHVHYNDVRDHSGFNFRFIPDYLKKYVVEFFKDTLAEGSLNDYYSALLKDICAAVASAEHLPNLFAREIKKLKEQDKLRGIEAKDYIPKFCELIAKDGYDL